jgi:hypothetical protein
MAAPFVAPEGYADPPIPARPPLSAPPGPTPAPKKRSCAVCRKRKVRCDKQSPCSNCRLADIPCIVPSAERRPRWARRLQRASNDAAAPVPRHDGDSIGDAMDRLHHLENLVKEMAAKLKETPGATQHQRTGILESDDTERSRLSSGAQHSVNKTTSTNVDDSPNESSMPGFQDASLTHNADSGFWSSINNEVCRILRLSNSHSLITAPDRGSEAGSPRPPDRQ